MAPSYIKEPTHVAWTQVRWKGEPEDSWFGMYRKKK